MLCKTSLPYVLHSLPLLLMVNDDVDQIGADYDDCDSDACEDADVYLYSVTYVCFPLYVD